MQKNNKKNSEENNSLNNQLRPLSPTTPLRTLKYFALLFSFLVIKNDDPRQTDKQKKGGEMKESEMGRGEGVNEAVQKYKFQRQSTKFIFTLRPRIVIDDLVGNDEEGGKRKKKGIKRKAIKFQFLGWATKP